MQKVNTNNTNNRVNTVNTINMTSSINIASNGLFCYAHKSAFYWKVKAGIFTSKIPKNKHGSKVDYE